MQKEPEVSQAELVQGLFTLEPDLQIEVPSICLGSTSAVLLPLVMSIKQLAEYQIIEELEYGLSVLL